MSDFIRQVKVVVVKGNTGGPPLEKLYHCLHSSLWVFTMKPPNIDPLILQLVHIYFSCVSPGVSALDGNYLSLVLYRV